MARLIILGSSSTFPFPRTVTNQMRDYSDIENYNKKFTLHDDIICKKAKAGGKERRIRSSIAIVTDKGTLMIDAGPDISYQLKRYKINPNVVFITHDHSDANSGIKYLKDVKIMSETAGSIKVGMEYNFFGLKITPFRVSHATNVKTCGFKIVSDNTKIAYMSDISNLLGIKKHIADCDMIFADGSNLDQNLPTHLSIVTQLTAYKKWGIKKVWFTHIGHKNLPHEELRKYCRSIYKPTDIVYDGQTFDI